ncbi:hypothetical protein ABVF61_20785 [Roseibium sp. HPY-6]|uniref:hypothetical protein n=1 Tax=Roseibium sp. HPY-6 TaxID=3229852 RepID=UPI00338E9BFE
MNNRPISQLLKQLKRDERNLNFSPQNRTFREIIARTPRELHGFLEHQVFRRGDIQDLRCAGDDDDHFDFWREQSGICAPDRVSEAFNQKIEDLRQEIKDAFGEIVDREAAVVGDIVARRGTAEAIEHIEKMKIRAFVI